MTTNRLTPTSVDLGQGRTAQAIAVESSHTCAIMGDALIKCWGRNRSGQLGDGTTTKRPTPTSVDLE